MSKSRKLAILAAGIVSLSLSSVIWADSTSNMMWDPINDTLKSSAKIVEGLDNLGMHHQMSSPVYIITDKESGNNYEMDGVKCGKIVSHESGMVINEEELIGDKITDVRTNNSGVITGIKEQGTMDVTHANGKTVRYQYVTFKIHPEK